METLQQARRIVESTAEMQEIGSQEADMHQGMVYWKNFQRSRLFSSQR